jgi:hypothetical protein
MKPRITACILFTFALCAFGQSPDQPKYGPVQAEFIKHINVRQLSKGDTVFARVTLAWEGPHCSLREGATLEGKVVQADPHKGRTDSKLAVAFTTAQCNGTEMEPFPLVVAAVADTPIDWKTLPDSQFRMPISFSNPHGNGMLPGMGSASAGDTYNTHVEMMGIIHRFPMSPKVKPGDVIGIKGYKLDVGEGPEHSSVLEAKGHDVSLSAYSQILLVPASAVFETAAPFAMPKALPKEAAAPIEPPPAPVVNDLEVCAPPGCAVDLPVSAAELEGRDAASISVKPLGYVPRPNKVLDGFDHEEAIAWLGPRQLLFVFNPHLLVKRASGSGTARVLRAVLLNTDSRTIVRAVDWEITDRNEYLWRLAEGRVLAHVGNELRVYSADLDVERRIPLAGALAFVRTSPNGEVIAVATRHERHSPELHQKLRDDTGWEPEEDVRVSILNKNFEQVAEGATTSSLQPPTLLNEGQAKLLAQPGLHYRIAMTTWDNKTTTLARFKSYCTPDLSSIAPDLLFLLSCDADGAAMHYRTLRADGKMLLHGDDIRGELAHDAAGGTDTFAVKVVRAERPITPGGSFKPSELASQEVRVFRASDGKRLMTAHVKDPIASHGTYALSPDGSHLAVLSESQISFFAVPAS